MPMQRRHLALLLLLGLLLVWGWGAADAQAPLAACDPSTLAMRIAHFCVSRMGSAPCCEALRDSVDHCGGVPCLCVVSGEPAIVLNLLNSSALLAVYAACGGQRAGGANFATACALPPSDPVDILPVLPLPPDVPRRRRKQQRPSPPPPQQQQQQQLVVACDSPTLSARIAHNCVSRMGSAPCCEALLDSVDLCGGVPCLCSVSDQPVIVLNELNASFLLTVYNHCGGLRARGAHLAAACDSPPSPSEDVVYGGMPLPLPPRPAPAPAGGGANYGGLHRVDDDLDLGETSWTDVHHHCTDD